MIKLILLILLITFAFCVLHPVTTVEGVKSKDDKQCREYECKQPTVSDPNLKVELIHQWNGTVSSMAFLGHDILILDKNNGTVNSIINGNIVDTPLLDVNVANKRERGLLGISVPHSNNNTKHVYLYYTESKNTDGSDICSDATGRYLCEPGTEPLGNRLYRYELAGTKLVNPKLLLNLPVTPGPAHNGGVIQIGPDNNIYVTIGDLNNKKQL